MSRYSLIAIIVAFFSFFLTASPTHAQAPNSGSTTTQSPACSQVAWSCTEVTDLDEGLPSAPHRMQLTQSGLPPTDPSGNPTQFYVACGTETDEGYLATTGNPALDERLCLGKDTLSKLQREMEYKLTLLNTQNPFTSADGSIDITVRPQNAGDPRNHTCMIGWTMPVVVTGSEGTNDPNTNEASGSTSSLKYTSFTFNSATAACMSVYSDPYGRVYNKDLKPVPGAKVSLFDFDSKALINLFGLPNPVTTESTGIFNFNLPPGRTYLQTSLTNTPLDVHPNYSLAYTSPYAYGDVIVETGEKAEQRDIPVTGGNQPVLELNGYANVRVGNEIHIHGIASWPLTIVDVMQGTTSIATQQSNKFGNFSFRLNPDSIDPSQQLTIKLTEVDLTVNPKVPAANPATDSITFDPIPSYLEGYAYNAQGKLVPFATVRIRMTQSDSIYYTTKADGNAFYTVAPRNLPILPYYIEIVAANVLPSKVGLPSTTQTPGTTVTPIAIETTPTATTTGGVPSKITIPTYAKQNKEYHSTQAIDIMAATKNGKPVDPSSVASASDAVFGSDKANDGTARETSVKASPSAQDQATAQRNYMTLLLAVALLIFIGSGVVVFMRKRAHSDSDMPSGGVYTKDESVDKPKDE
ncbi:carboxypeptidase regulatory-like domain-containing protein [Candidatus Woesebacteria bacterium]|nr:carboxypeptidase regulatory-like domain-containing protein [Candidatus Woesebacteria bacterium]